MNLPNLVFSFMIILALMHLFNFHMSFSVSLTIYVKEEAGILIRTTLNLLINLRSIAMFRIFREPQSSWPHFSEIMKYSQGRSEEKVRARRFQSGPGRNIQIEMFRDWHVLVTDIERMCLALKCYRRLSEVQNWAPRTSTIFSPAVCPCGDTQDDKKWTACKTVPGTNESCSLLLLSHLWLALDFLGCNPVMLRENSRWPIWKEKTGHTRQMQCTLSLTVLYQRSIFWTIP